MSTALRGIKSKVLVKNSTFQFVFEFWKYYPQIKLLTAEAEFRILISRLFNFVTTLRKKESLKKSRFTWDMDVETSWNVETFFWQTNLLMGKQGIFATTQGWPLHVLNSKHQYQTANMDLLSSAAHLNSL